MPPPIIYHILRELLDMNVQDKQKKKHMKIREKKVKKLMKQAKCGREEAERWVSYTESFDKKKIKEIINN